MREVGMITQPYHAFVPSFGEWGFVLATQQPLDLSGRLPEGLRFVTPEALATLFFFPIDMSYVDTEPNRLNNQTLVRYYETEWARYGL